MRWREYIRQHTLSELVFMVFLFFLPWQTQWVYRAVVLNGAAWQYGTLGFFVTEALLWLSVCLFLFERIRALWQRGRTSFQWSFDRLSVLFFFLFCLFAFASMLWAGDALVAQAHALRLMEAGLVFFLIMLSRLPWQRLAWPLVLGAIPVIFLSIWQFFTQSSPVFSWLGLSLHETWVSGTAVVANTAVGRWLRAYGSFSHPNVLGGYLVLVSTCVLFLYERYGKESWQRIFLVIISLLSTTGVFFSWSRSAWLALGILFFITLALNWSKKERQLWMRFFSFHALIAVIFIAIYFPLVATRVTISSPTEVRSMSERAGGIHEAMLVLKSHPWKGVGVGNYTAALQELRPGLPGFAYQPVHVAPLVLLGELGIMGIGLLFLACLYGCLLVVRQRGKKVFSYFFVFIPLLLFDHYLYSIYIGLVMGAVFVGLCVKRAIVEDIPPGHPQDIHSLYPSTVNRAKK